MAGRHHQHHHGGASLNQVQIMSKQSSEPPKAPNDNDYQSIQPYTVLDDDGVKISVPRTTSALAEQPSSSHLPLAITHSRRPIATQEDELVGDDDEADSVDDNVSETMQTIMHST